LPSADKSEPEVPGSPTAAALTVTATPGDDPGEVSIAVDLVAIDEDGASYSGVSDGDVTFDDPTDDFGSPLGSIEGDASCSARKFKNTERSASVVLLMDQSGSISGTDPEDLRIIGGKEFLRAMGPDDDVLLMSFAEMNTCATDDVMVYGSFTSDPRSVEGQLDALQGCQEGGTPLWDASVAALAELEMGGKNNNKALVIFTDGADTSFVTTVNDVVAAATAKEIRVFTVGLSDSVEIAVLSSLAQATGGAFFFARDVGGMVSAFRGMNLLLTGDYDRSSCDQKLKIMNPGLGMPTSFVTRARIKVNGTEAEAPVSVQIAAGGSSAGSGGNGSVGGASFAGSGGSAGSNSSAGTSFGGSGIGGTGGAPNCAAAPQFEMDGSHQLQGSFSDSSVTGRVSDDVGPLNGAHSFFFVLWSEPQAGVPNWFEVQELQVQAGCFVSQPFGVTKPLPASGEYYLSISIDGGAELVPRVPLEITD
jgi:hypothetical protein